MASSLKIKIHNAISAIPYTSWNSLLHDNTPFIQHEFLQALEDNGCVGESFGWLPQHIAIYEGGELVAALPLYEKHNSYGEFVFDHAWADAWYRAGLNYFPKLVSAIPYTPAQGQRLLCDKDKLETYAPLLLKTTQELAKSHDHSGCHFLFSADKEQQWLSHQKLFVRNDCQFHWHNQNYKTFDDFLAQLTAKKRKNIRQERQRVQKQGVNFRILDGHTASEQDWQDMDRFYRHTFQGKSGTPTLNLGFLMQIAETLPDSIVLVLADKGGHCIAGSMMFRSDTTLYGRFWGCDESVDKLHFEACYYQGIQYCIDHGLALFEPGAGGEHKIARGFVPTLTQSSHYLIDNPFSQSIEHYIEHERDVVEGYIIKCLQHSPYKVS
ncbi:MAG: N-acetyltransferase [Thiotrichaceae bacterium]|nr:N-acetyltransferase [Thiotrichaceae bacterium]